MDRKMNLFLEYGKKLIWEMLGFFLVALGSVMFLYSDMGLNPWGVLHQGISIKQESP